MPFEIELFGIPRARAGIDRLLILPDRESATLAEILQALGQACPAFATACLDGDRLRKGFIASVGGQCFLSDETTSLSASQPILILSADGGG